MKALFVAEKVVFKEQSLTKSVIRTSSASRIGDYRHFHTVGSLRRLRKFLEARGAQKEIMEMMDNNLIPRAYVGAIANLALGGFPTKRIMTLMNVQIISEQIRRYEGQSMKDKLVKVLLMHFPNFYFSYLRYKGKNL
ncbi:MAG: Glycosyl transferase [Mesotoga prima]|uniref:Glycosyl transferase n=1 Tax=Mesotoga prima TaxID=1184387 RepID=A0A101HL72_9BACT|nr:MAG: Glycosyl transferase [Mesotoga prima]